MKSVQSMSFDLHMNHILKGDDRLYMPESEIKLIYAIYQADQAYDGPHSHGPPIADVIDIAVDYGFEPADVSQYIEQNKYTSWTWSVKNDHITIVYD